MLSKIRKIFYAAVAFVDLMGILCIDSESKIPLLVVAICHLILFIGVTIHWDWVYRNLIRRGD